MTPEQKKRLLIAALLCAVVLILHQMGIGKYINFAFFAEHKEQIQAFITQHYGVSVLLYILLNLVVVATTIPISMVVNIIGGYLFGLIPGVLYTNIGVTLGALTSFFVVRYLLADAFKAKYAQAAQRFEAEIKKRGTTYILAMQLFPLTPFALINILAALSGISVWSFYWATALGILPGQIIYAYAGRQLATVDTVKEVMSPPLFIALMLLALLSFVPMLLRRLGILKTDSGLTRS